MSDLLVRLFGYRALLHHGDPLVYDRWRWFRGRLRRYGPGGAHLVDAGCGNGAFVIGASKLGYAATGLTWDRQDQERAEARAAMVGAHRARFEVQDVRKLDDRPDLTALHDVVVSFENVEHVLADDKLVTDLAGLLKPGGVLLLTTPNAHYRPIDASDAGPFLPIEDGRHVRKGYEVSRLRELATHAGLEVVEVSSCSGWVSQKLAAVQRRSSRVHALVGWLAILALRWLPPIVDSAIRRFSGWPDYSVCMVARRPSTTT